jgi:DNA-binding CsgD family transcriptional regulator
MTASIALAEPASMHARMAELLGRLSLAFDIANDCPYGKAVRSVVLALELGKRAGASGEVLRDTYWLSLFAYLGCTGAEGDQAADGYGRAMCDTSIRLARIVGAGSRVVAALGELYERCDGRVAAGARSTEGLSLPTRLHQLAHVAEIAHDRRGRAGATALVRRQAGAQLDARLGRVFLSDQAELFAAIEDPCVLDRFLALEPRPFAWADEGRMDDIARALAIFTDIKCPIFFGHSTGVATLAERAAVQMGLPEHDKRSLRWAALLHDIGRVGVPNAIWMRPGPLDWAQWERVRLHAHYTERVLAPIGALSAVTEIAVAAHERVDGSGYDQRRSGRALGPPARLLAAADVAHAMSEERPHRPALDAAAVARELVGGVREGRLDGQAVDAVLASLGMETRAEPRSPAGLSEREVDVCRLLARGKTNKEIADLLAISVRTVHNHVQHIFDKLGVHSRSGAAIWLMDHDFVC